MRAEQAARNKAYRNIHTPTHCDKNSANARKLAYIYTMAKHESLPIKEEL